MDNNSKVEPSPAYNKAAIFLCWGENNFFSIGPDTQIACVAVHCRKLFYAALCEH